MDKNETSRMRVESWTGTLRRLSPDSRTRLYDPTVTLRDPAFIHKAILQAVGEGDFEAVVEIYRAHLRVLNRTRAAKGLGISRQSVHKMLRSANIPSLKTFTAFMKLLKNGASTQI